MAVFGWHRPVPEQPPPDQPLSREPGEGVALSVSSVPASTDVEHVDPQSIPPTSLETLPDPVPFVATSSSTEGGVPPTNRGCSTSLA
jgi:hypothetical protein